MGKALRGVTALAIIAWLLRCGAGASGREYPSDWPAPLPGAEGSTICADLSGRYAIGVGVLAAVFVPTPGTEDHGIHWHTMHIVDEGAQGPTLDFLGSGIDDDRMVDRYVLIARDRDGNVVAQEVIERYRTISLWASGGAVLGLRRCEAHAHAMASGRRSRRPAADRAGGARNDSRAVCSVTPRRARVRGALALASNGLGHSRSMLQKSSARS